MLVKILLLMCKHIMMIYVSYLGHRMPPFEKIVFFPVAEDQSPNLIANSEYLIQ